MPELNNQQIELISAYIRQHGVAHEALHDDLLDHVCTSIENLMDAGLTFEEAFAKTIKLFGPGGLKQVQQQTFELLTEMNESMKKVAFVFGLTSAILLLAGTIFKLQHWPGAGIMIVLGGALLTLGYLPMLLFHKLKESPGNEAIMHISGFLGMGMTALGATFKIMHWPGAAFLLIGGLAVLGFLYIPIYFFKKYKTSSNKPVTLSASLVALTCLVLVFALVNVNTSAHFNNGLIQINKQIDESTSQLLLANEEMHRKLGANPEAQELRNSTLQVIEYIEELKQHLMAEAQDVEDAGSQTFSPQDLRDMNNLGTPIHILWESQPSDAHSIVSLRDHLKSFQNQVLDLYPDEMRAGMEGVLPFAWLADEDEGMDWLKEHFYRVQLFVVLAQLSNFQSDAQHAETQGLIYLLSRPEASDPPSGS